MQIFLLAFIYVTTLAMATLHYYFLTNNWDFKGAQIPVL